MFRSILSLSLICLLGCGLHEDKTRAPDHGNPADAGDAPADVDDGAASDTHEPVDDGSGDPPDGPTEPDTDPPVPQSDTGSEGGETSGCGDIEAANPAWEVCTSSETECAGVFTDGAGCTAYCAAAGMVCTARYGGEPGCTIEVDQPQDCDVSNGHASDWCVCGLSDETEPTPSDEDCPGDPSRPPVSVEQDYREATYDRRNNWVLDCYPYAYTAAADEHTECDSTYAPDGSRHGTATFVFEDLPTGMYDAYMGGRHTENRNPSGALFIVDGHGLRIDQRDDSGAYAWDHHGQYCLGGRVEVVLDSAVDSGSDSVIGVRLDPVE